MKNVFIDIGTNLMQGFKQISSLNGIDENWLKIFVEPNPECWEYIDAHTINVGDFVFYKNAMNTIPGTVNLVTRPDIKSDLAATIMGKDYLDTMLAKFGISINDHKHYEIEAITWDNILSNVNSGDNVIIKIDAEGIEYEILNQLLDRNIDFNIVKVYCEFHVLNNEHKLRKEELLARWPKNIELINWH